MLSKINLEEKRGGGWFYPRSLQSFIRLKLSSFPDDVRKPRFL